MKSISLKLQDQILKETDQLLERLQTSRNKYINEAVEFYNRFQKRKLLAEQLTTESELIADDSMAVLREFDVLDDEEQAI